MRIPGRNLFVICICVLNLWVIRAAAQSPVIVNAAFETQHIIPEILHDRARQFQSDSIIFGKFDSLFIPSKEYYVSFPEDSSGYWLHFTVQNDLSRPKTVILWLGRRNFDNFDLWQQAPSGKIAHLGHVGSSYSRRATFSLTNGYYYAITLQPGRNVYRAKISNVFGPAYISVSLLSMENFTVQSRCNVLLFGIFIGIMMASLILAGQMLYQYRDPGYFFYCAYIVAIMLREAFNNAAFVDFSPVMMRHCVTFLIVCTFGMFLRYFLRLKDINKSLDFWVNCYIRSLMAMMALYIMVIFLGTYPLANVILQVTMGSSLFFILLSLLACFRLFKTNERARVVIYAFLPIAAAFILNLLHNLNVIPNYPFLEYALVWGFMLEVIIFTMAFTRWFRVMEADRNLYQLKFSVEQQQTLLAVQVAEQRVKDRIARDLHDDVAASMSGIRILTQVAQRQFADKAPQAMPLLEQINRSTTTMLESIGDLIWAIKSHPDYLNDLADRIREYATRTLDASNIAYQLDIPRDLPVQELDVEMRRNIYLILKEAINNVVLHSQCHQARIVIKVLNRTVILSIEDDGKGFNPIDKARRQGLENMTWRAESIHADFSVQSYIDQGTRVRLILPLEINPNRLYTK